jgi:hypothetical protein
MDVHQILLTKVRSLNYQFRLNMQLKCFGHSLGLEKDTEKSKLCSGIQVVVGLDFGSTSFVLSIHKVTKEQELFSGKKQTQLKNEVLIKDSFLVYYKYDNNIAAWGDFRACKLHWCTIEELFNLHLGDLPDNLKPKLSVDYIKIITDYLREIGKVMSHI